MTANNFTLEELKKIHATFAGGIALKAKAQIEALKPSTVRIGGFDVPAPAREKLELRENYFIPSPGYNEGYGVYNWVNNRIDNRLLASGQIHLTAEAAQKHNEALVSFTKLGDE